MDRMNNIYICTPKKRLASNCVNLVNFPLVSVNDNQ